MQADKLQRFRDAAAWVAENGMTLPPDTPQQRSLRNWFCFKLNQFKKGTLGAANEALLMEHGLDFSEYEALRNGRGTRDPDHPHITALNDWFTAHGTYDLDERAAPELIEWQRLMLDNYCGRGDTPRITQICGQLPGLVPGLWRKPGQAPMDEADRQWWATAQEFLQASREHPSYLGQINPDLPRHLIEWALSMQVRATLEKGRHVQRQRGFLTGVGVLIDRAERDKRQRTERERAAQRDATLYEPTYGQKDRRLTSWLGVAMYARMSISGASDREIMAAFGIGPIDLVGVREKVGHTFRHESGVQLCTSSISYARKLYLQVGLHGVEALTARRYPDPRVDWPVSMNRRRWATLNAIQQAHVALLPLQIEQDICVY